MRKLVGRQANAIRRSMLGGGNIIETVGYFALRRSCPISVAPCMTSVRTSGFLKKELRKMDKPGSVDPCERACAHVLRTSEICAADSCRFVLRDAEIKFDWFKYVDKHDIEDRY